MTEWGPWIEPTPMTEITVGVTPETCSAMWPRVRKLRSGLWEAQPAVFRPRSTVQWDTACRIVAWAKPIKPVEDEQWWIALTYLTSCYLKPHPNAGPTYTNPRWRTAWMAADKQKLRPAEPPTKYPSDFWRDSLSDAIAEFAASIGVVP